MTTPNPTRSYRGRPGCGCGCRGRYAEPGQRGLKNDVRDLAAALAAGITVHLDGQPDSDALILHEGLDGEAILAYETETRSLWAYFASGAEALAFVDAHTPDPVPAGATPIA